MNVKASVLPCQKHLFSLDEDTHYFNCAYMSPLLKTVEEAGIAGIQRKRDPSHLSSSDFFTQSDELRRCFATLINAPDPLRVAIVPSASYAIANVARNVDVQPGQKIVLLHEQFPSNVYAWRTLAAKGVTIQTVMPPTQTDGRATEWNQRILAAIDRNTAIVAVAPIQWADGTLFDLERIGQKARDVGAAFVIDGTQSVGAMPFELQNIQADALICAGYKWLLGPYSMGLAYFGPRFDDGEPIEHGWLMRRGSEDFSQLVNYQDDYQPGAIRYDVGERSNFILVPMAIAALEQILAWGVENIQAYCHQLTQPFIERVRTIGYWAVEDDWRAAHLLGIRTPPQVNRETLLEALTKKKIALSVRGESIRISAHLYNDENDFEVLFEVLKQAIK